MIEFSHDKKWIGFWFVHPPTGKHLERQADFFCASWLNPDGTLQFAYRWHYYDFPDRPADGERSWYGWKSSKPVEAAEIEKNLEMLTGMAQLNVLRNRTKMDFINCQLCGVDEALEKLEEYPWWHRNDGQAFEDEL